MATKAALEQLLQKNRPPKPQLVRGAGMSLSTDQVAVTPKERKPKRVKRGYALREDLIHKCKRIAVREDKPLYQIMEEGLELLISSRSTHPSED